jgi:LruC domain-containing protein
MNSGAVLTGMLQVCAPTAVPAARLSGGAANGCSLYIALGGCYSEGNGSVAIADADADGVADATDEYPSDAAKAYNSYYPSSTGNSTVAFEDQWPSKGDFDMNDVVVSYRYQVVTNASNNVVRVIGNYTLLATGGELGNGFGVQFPVNATNVTNVTGGTQEAGQTKAVLIVFSDMRSQMANWNTVYGAVSSPAVNYTVSFDVTGGPSISSFGLNSYNPFIWNYGLGNNRGREIHLVGRAPTDLGYTSYFGTADDNSSVASNRYFVTTTGLPYAIDIPVSPFNYPVELKDITQAYLHIGQWAESGGASYTDWYSNTATDYRNTSNLYIR